MALMFHISDSDSDTPEEDRVRRAATKVPPSGGTLQIPGHKAGKLSTRHRVNSEDQTSRRSEHGEEGGFSSDDTPFRGRSRSAPPALWAAKKYGQQLRRMSDEFDTLLSKADMRRVRSAGSARQMRKSSSWFPSFWSHKETDGDASITDSETFTAE
ncbi:BCL2 associated agonist of cell death b [Clupea harengus]|uniref:BCL2 associated agonist of cell death b n=1 Tax=Clupea harengus TaxID=7950 RepID=A0A6P3VPF1_CLUHA|nr:BCL2 associated agonist of cell death b [Clupea harengus]